MTNSMMRLRYGVIFLSLLIVLVVVIGKNMDFNLKEYLSPYNKIYRVSDYEGVVDNSDLKYDPYNPKFENRRTPVLSLPSNVVGCGGRRGPCLGGTQVTIPTPMVSKSLPINIPTRFDPNDPRMIPHQVGVIYKVFGNDNDIYPLYGAKRYGNSSEWDYYAIIQKAGGSSLKIPVRTKNNNEMLGTNDEVILDIHRENPETYRVTIYQDFGQYYPQAL